MGFSPLSRHQNQQVRYGRSQAPTITRSTLRVSHPLGVCSLPKIPCGLVSCHNHVRGSPFRGFPSRAATITFQQPCTLMPLAKFACQPESWRQRPSSRLQGFESARRVRELRHGCYSAPDSDPLMGFHPSSGVPSTSVGDGNPPPPSRGLIVGAFKLTPTTALRSINPPVDRLASLEAADPSRVSPPRLPPS